MEKWYRAKQGIFCMVIVLNFLVVGGTEQSEFKTWVDNYIKTYTVPRGKAVGLGVVVVSNNYGAVPFYIGAFGYRDKEKSLPVTASTLHPIASISKSFASTLIVKILSEKFPQYGENVLEVPVKELLSSNLNNPVNWTLNDRYRAERVSFRDLLSHRTCLTGDIIGAIFGAVQTTEEYIYRTRFEWEYCPFRTAYGYNNAMYCLAGALISQIAGQPFESLMKNFLVELGMTETRIGEINQSYASMTNMMQPYYTDDSGVVRKGNANLLRQLAVTLPAAGIITTLNDMAKYLSFHMNAGSINGKQIISPQVHGWLTKTAIPISSDSTYGMGFELFVMNKGESPLLDHGGYYPPYVAHVDIYPTIGISIFTASAGPGGATQGSANIQLHNAILSYFMSRRTRTALDPMQIIPYKNYNFMNPPVQEKRSQPTKTSTSNNLRINKNDSNKTRAVVSIKDFVGSFGAPVLGEIQISLKTATALKLNYGIWGEADLVPLDSSGYLYKIKWTSDIVMYFSSEADGNSVENILEFETKDQFLWYSMGGNTRRFWKNCDVSCWSEIPWEDGSC